MRSIVFSTLAVLATTASIAVAAPLTFTHQGRLFDAAGDPLTGSHTIAFSLNDAPSGGAVIWSEPHTVQFDDGYYAVVLGDVTPLNPDDFGSDEVYLGMAVDGAPPLARLQLHSVPWALRADTATNVDGGIVNATEIRVNGNTVIDSSGAAKVAWSDLSAVPAGFADGTDDGWTPPACATNQELFYNGTAWACQETNAHAHDAAEIMSGTISMDRLSVGNTPGTLARGDHGHNGVEALSCASGQVPEFDGAAWSCVASNAHGHNGVEALSCAADEIPQFDGSAWVCATDVDVWAPGIDGGVQYSGGNVGIGTDTPAAALDVVGDIAYSGVVMHDGYDQRYDYPFYRISHNQIGDISGSSRTNWNNNTGVRWSVYRTLVTGTVWTSRDPEEQEILTAMGMEGAQHFQPNIVVAKLEWDSALSWVSYPQQIWAPGTVTYGSYCKSLTGSVLNGVWVAGMTTSWGLCGTQGGPHRPGTYLHAHPSSTGAGSALVIWPGVVAGRFPLDKGKPMWGYWPNQNL